MGVELLYLIGYGIILFEHYQYEIILGFALFLFVLVLVFIAVLLKKSSAWYDCDDED